MVFAPVIVESGLANGHHFVRGAPRLESVFVDRVRDIARMNTCRLMQFHWGVGHLLHQPARIVTNRGHNDVGDADFARSLQDLVDSFGEIWEINMGVGVDQVEKGLMVNDCFELGSCLTNTWCVKSID